MRTVRPFLRKGSAMNPTSMCPVRRLWPLVRRTLPPDEQTPAYAGPDIDRIIMEFPTKPGFRTRIDACQAVLGGAYRAICSIRGRHCAILLWPPAGSRPVIDPTSSSSKITKGVYRFSNSGCRYNIDRRRDWQRGSCQRRV